MGSWQVRVKLSWVYSWRPWFWQGPKKSCLLSCIMLSFSDILFRADIFTVPLQYEYGNRVVMFIKCPRGPLRVSKGIYPQVKSSRCTNRLYQVHSIVYVQPKRPAHPKRRQVQQNASSLFRLAIPICQSRVLLKIHQHSSPSCPYFMVKSPFHTV